MAVKDSIHRAGHSHALRVEHMSVPAAKVAKVADVIGWYREQIQHWIDHELAGQVRAWVRTSAVR